jgi:hypothetical protein
MKTYLPLFLLILATSFVQAQTSDLSMEKVFCKKTLMQSTPGNYMYMLEFDYTIKNLGPDSITPNDTIYVYWREDWSSYVSFARIKLSKNTIAPGDTMMRKKDQVFMSVPDKSMIENAKFCMKVNASRDGVNRDNNTMNDEYCETTNTGIANLVVPQLIPVYPNPVTSAITIDESITDFTIELFDVTGRRVVHEHTQSNNTLSVSQLPPGIYAYRITTVNNQVLSGKLVKKD